MFAIGAVLFLGAVSPAMKIAIFSDTHLGYARFEADSYAQAERVVEDATRKADLILCAGDVFDVKVPKLETLKRAVELFNRADVPVFVIHGNHERRARDMVNAVQLLAAGTKIRVLNGESAVWGKNGETVQVFGLGSVPEEYAQSVLERRLKESYKPEEGAFKILMLHQSVKELVPADGEELTLAYLETLPFDLIVNGHIHETMTKLDGRFVIPGSTVITQLKKEEMAPKGYFLYDTSARKSEFVEVPSRRFFYEALVFSDASEMDVKGSVEKRIDGIRKAHPDAIIAIKIDGTLKKGLSTSDIKLEERPGIFIENRLNAESLGARLEKIRVAREANLSARGELAMKELKAKTAGKVTLFDSSEIFDKLLAGTEETMEYLEKINKKSAQ